VYFCFRKGLSAVLGVCSIKHGPKKADYVDDVFNVINWRQVQFTSCLLSLFVRHEVRLIKCCSQGGASQLTVAMV
jgi:hypothetical protein